MRYKFNNKKIVYGFLIILTFGVAWYFSRYHYQLMLIQGRSMEPTYHNLQIVMLNKNFEESDITYGDVIAFWCEELDSVLVKRVVARTGDEAVIIDGKLYVNDKMVKYYEDDIFEYAGRLEEEIHLENGGFLVIGDNVAESKDSRYPEVGIVDCVDVIGVVISHANRSDN